MDSIQLANDAVCENRTITAEWRGVPGSPMVANQQAISRARLKQLFALAYETVEWLESKGLKKGEQCEFREIAERLWWKE